MYRVDLDVPAEIRNLPCHGVQHLRRRRTGLDEVEAHPEHLPGLQLRRVRRLRRGLCLVHAPTLGRRTDTTAEAVGPSRWVRVLLCVGYGPLAISQIKIGDTPIERRVCEIHAQGGVLAGECGSLLSNFFAAKR